MLESAILTQPWPVYSPKQPHQLSARWGERPREPAFRLPAHRFNILQILSFHSRKILFNFELDFTRRNEFHESQIAIGHRPSAIGYP
ncbi:MAG TPA: hypothetical protein VK327_18815, partial [Candidatus Paceibacterota bacterium]|nr:hypothetical protein [Candidatus Paceibacterota bacterium]